MTTHVSQTRTSSTTKACQWLIKPATVVRYLCASLHHFQEVGSVFSSSFVPGFYLQAVINRAVQFLTVYNPELLFGCFSYAAVDIGLHVLFTEHIFSPLVLGIVYYIFLYINVIACLSRRHTLIDGRCIL